MAHGQFIVTEVNPNDNQGGGGCVCDPRKQVDCKPPYIVCYANDMVDDLSPHVVICRDCVCRMGELLGGEVLSAGERNTIPGTAVAQPAPRAENPEFDDSELVAALKHRDEDTPDI